MMKIRCHWMGLLSTLAILILIAPGTAQAGWHWTHGHSGQVEYPGLLITTPYVRPEGLLITGSMETSQWVHFAVPTLGDSGITVRYIKVRYTQNNPAGSTLAAVHVYNGETKVKEITGGWPTGSGIQEFLLDLGTAQSFDHGLGVSVEVYFGIDGGVDSFTFHGVGANFEGTGSSEAAFYVIPVKKKN